MLGFYVTECGLKHAFLPTSSLIHMTTSNKLKGNALVPRGCSFIACSNGMLLFGNHRSQTYYLCNFTRQACIHLPKPSYTCSNVAMGFHFDYVHSEFVLVRAELSDFPNYSCIVNMETIISTKSTIRWENSVPLIFAHFKFQIKPFECAAR